MRGLWNWIACLLPCDERVINLAALHKASVKVQSSGDVNLYASESKLSRMLLFLAEQVLAENGDLSCRAQRVNQNVEIVIEDLNRTTQKCDQEKRWQRPGGRNSFECSGKLYPDSGGVLRISESRCFIELPLFRQEPSCLDAIAKVRSG